MSSSPADSRAGNDATVTFRRTCTESDPEPVFTSRRRQRARLTPLGDSPIRSYTQGGPSARNPVCRAEAAAEVSCARGVGIAEVTTRGRCPRTPASAKGALDRPFLNYKTAACPALRAPPRALGALGWTVATETNYCRPW